MLEVIGLDQNNNKVDIPVTGDVGNSLVEQAKAYTDAKNSYSTTEMLTGGKWIDGKPIYRVTFDYTATTAGVVAVADLTSLNIDKVTLLLGTVYGSTWVQPSYYNGSSARHRPMYNMTDKIIYFDTDSTISVRIILEYTKTTD